MFMACSIIRCIIFFFSSRRRHTRCALVTGVQTCALPILMTLDAFCEVVDRYFEGPDWEAKPVPSQSIPATLERVLAALDALKPTGWLAMDNALRDLDGDARDRISYLISDRSEEHTSELQSLMRISYAVFCLKKKKIDSNN